MYAGELDWIGLATRYPPIAISHIPSSDASEPPTHPPTPALSLLVQTGGGAMKEAAGGR